MPPTNDDLHRRAQISTLLHERAEAFGLARVAVPDAAAAFTAAGGALSSGPAGAHLPSGTSLHSWISDQREFAPHWFAPVVSTSVAARPVDKPKLNAAQRRARATVLLGQQNGDNDGVKL